MLWMNRLQGFCESTTKPSQMGLKSLPFKKLNKEKQLFYIS